MAVDNVIVKSSTGVDGNSYTTAISNDKLTNDDFLKLMLEEMKMQDPTKPMDTQNLMDSQLKMSTIEANADMSKSLAALTKSFTASSLSNAVGFMGKVIENGQTNEDLGIPKAFMVDTIESKDGEVYLNAKEQIGYHHNIRTSKTVDGVTTYTNLTYDKNGKIYDENGDDTEVNAVILADGKFQIVDGKYVFNDNDGNRITDEEILKKYEITPALPTFADKITSIPVTSITKVRG